jgi:hypothetical protein
VALLYGHIYYIVLSLHIFHIVIHDRRYRRR